MPRFVFEAVLHTGLTLLATMLFILLCPPDIYRDWVGFVSICAIPAELCLVGLLAAPETPFSKLSHPRRGGLALIFAVIAGAVVYSMVLFAFGVPATGVRFDAMIFVIFSVVITVWWLMVFGQWPLARLGTVRATGLLFVLCYPLTLLLFLPLFDFTGMVEVPARLPEATTAGFFPVWPAIVYAITTLGVVFALSGFARVPFRSGRHQPLAGVETALMVLLVSGVLMGAVVGLLGVPPVTFMLRGPIAFMFGFFLLRDYVPEAVWAGLPPARRGLMMGGAGLLLGTVLLAGLEVFQHAVAPGLSTGAPGFERELWLANALLSVAFPLMLVYRYFFSLWPVAGRGA